MRSSGRSASDPEAEFVVPGAATSSGSISEGTDTPAVLAAAKDEGVAFVAGPDFMLEGGESSLRLSFASVPAERVDEGVARLARALESARAHTPARLATTAATVPRRRNGSISES